MHKSACIVVLVDVYWGTTDYDGVDVIGGPEIRLRA